MNLGVGQTIVFERTGSDPVKLKAGNVDLTEGVMGHIGKNVSVRVSRPLKPAPRHDGGIRGARRTPGGRTNDGDARLAWSSKVLFAFYS